MINIHGHVATVRTTQYAPSTRRIRNLNPRYHRIQRHRRIRQSIRAMLRMMICRQRTLHLPTSLNRTMHHLPTVNAMVNVEPAIRPHEFCRLTDGLQRRDLHSFLRKRLGSRRVAEVKVPWSFLHKFGCQLAVVALEWEP